MPWKECSVMDERMQVLIQPAHGLTGKARDERLEALVFGLNRTQLDSASQTSAYVSR